MYAVRNFKTKKELKAAVLAGDEVRIFSPGFHPAPTNGTAHLEGPHAPQPHKWYATVTLVDGIVKTVK